MYCFNIKKKTFSQKSNTVASKELININASEQKPVATKTFPHTENQPILDSHNLLDSPFPLLA